MSRRLSDRPLENDVTRLFAQLRGWLTRTGAWVGRQVGGHVGLFGNGPLTSAFFEATDTTNTPFMSVGLDPSTEDSQWLRIGYATEPGIHLQDVTGHDLKQVRIDPACVTGVLPAGLDPSTLALLLCATGSGPPTGTGTIGQMYLDLVSATLWTYTATGWVAAFSRGQIGGHEHQEDAGGGKLDHGLALSAASLAEDDHPQYVLKSALVTAVGTPGTDTAVPTEQAVREAIAAAPGGGDVVGPAANSADSVPQWNGADSKTLKDGLTVVTTVGSPGADSAVPTEQAVREAIAAIPIGDVIGPVTNTDGKVPQWNGADSKTLKDGLTVVTTVGSPGADTAVPSEQAVREALAAVPGGGDVVGPATNSADHVPQWNGADSKTLKNGLSVVTSVGTPGADSAVPTEQAVREAIAAAGGLDANKVFALPFGTPPTAPVAGTVLIYADYLPSATNSIPQMTSATAPSGVASASESYATTPAWHAFDNTGAKNGWLTNGSALPQWIKYQFPAAKRIIAYSFRPWWADNFPSRTPISWTFQGSTNDSTWVTLDTHASWIIVNSIAYLLFYFANVNTYTYYRMNITANGGNAYTGIGGLKMFEFGSEVGLHAMDSSGAIKSLNL